MGIKTVVIFSLGLIMMMLAMIIFPAEAVKAAQAALNLWWRMILPSLLPFFISAELLLKLGLVPHLSRLLNPLMRPLFRLPGAAALAVLLGFSSGFPGGAAISAGLYQSGQINAEEGARLIAFTNNASPLYISVALAAGLLASPQLAGALMLVHYGGNLLIGIGLGFLAKKDYRQIKTAPLNSAVHKQVLEQISIGNLLKKAAYASFTNISLIGCYMTFFAVLLAMLEQGGILSFLLRPLYNLGLSPGLASALSYGIWEMSLGIEQAVQSGLALGQILPIIAAILAFGGFSVQAQVAAMVADCGIKIRLYMISRLLHGLISYWAMHLLCQKLALPSAPISVPLIIDSSIIWQYSLSLATILLIIGLCARLLMREA